MPSRTKNKNVLNNEGNENLLPCDCYRNCFLKAKHHLKERLIKNKNGSVVSPEHLQQLGVIVKQCISYGESNSVLIIGPHDGGKLKLVETVLEGENQETKNNYYYVYLSGIIHTDDKTALQDMARQLELENVVGDRVFGSFSDNLSFILDALKQDSGSSKSIIIVLDEFDCFTTHKNQSLLYNLFDIVQSHQNPLCVIGLTCRLDVVELLEKRVKSRYSHRTILNFPNYTFSEYLQIAEQLLLLSDESSCCSVFKSSWQHRIKGLLDLMDVTNILEKQYMTKKDISGLVQLLIVPICSLSSSHPFVTAANISGSYDMIHMDAKAAIIRGLSILQICIIVAAKHVTERRGGQPFNFEMIYNEYQRFSLRRLSGMQIFNKAVTFKAYEQLLSLELIKSTEASSRNISLSKEYRQMCMLIDSSQIHEALQQYPDCPTEIKNWAESMFA